MNIERFKQQLIEKERELLSQSARLEEEARLPGEAQVRDGGDAAVSDEGSAESLHEDSQASLTLIQVQDALRRIANGSYGKCIACGRSIEPRRLEAVPWAPYCLEDQRKHDEATHVEQGGATL